MKNKFRPGLLVCTLAVPLLVGGLSAMLSGDMMDEYALMNKPPLSPPGWMFPVVWTILYVMMGLASYLVLTSGAGRMLTGSALTFYGVQLILNFLWSLLFFNFSLYLFAFIDLIAMWICIVITMILFLRASIPACMLMVPYILWSSFALYLNYAVYKISLTPMPVIN